VFGFLLAVLLLIGFFMCVVVLLQAGKGGGLAAMGGAGTSDNLIGGRQAATLLTKSTWVSGALFLFLALVLSIMSSRQTSQESILRGQFPATAPQPLLPGTEAAPSATTPEGGAAPAPEGGTPPQQP
jgi:preprotein translocase subunit SecG